MVLSYAGGLGCKYKKIFQINHSVSFAIFWWLNFLLLSSAFRKIWELPREVKTSFETVVSKRNTSPQISFYYWLASLYRHWYMKYKFGLFLTQFWINDVYMQYFEELIIESNSPRGSIKYWFRSFYHHWYMIYNFWALFTQFGDNNVTKERHISEIWKIN